MLSKFPPVKSGVWLLLILCQAAATAYARSDYLDWWNEEYPASDASNAVCQMCHERGGGGNGWNRYGWRIRGQCVPEEGVNLCQNNENELRSILQDIESVPTDPNDAGSPTFIQEINANVQIDGLTLDAQPGWREGEVNVIRFRDDTPTSIISPPPTLPCALLIDQTSQELTCSTNNPIPTDIANAGPTVRLQTIADNFTAPVAAVAAPGQADYLYVVEQGGLVWRVTLDTGVKDLFLDFSSELVSNYGTLFGGFDERGLIGFAFHPDFANNQRVFTYISKDFQAATAHFSTMPMGQNPDHQTVISEWLVVNGAGPTAMATMEQELLIVDQPQFNHNGGMIKFGPDGYLYIAIGDGGGANDQGTGHGSDGNGRDNTNPLGSILRIDVDAMSPPNGRYGIPMSNPFVGQAGLDEIYLYGLRNPYRFSFEELALGAFNLYIGDVGQDAIEEVNRVHSNQAGSNLGWNYKEGTFYFSVIDGLTYVSPTPPDGVVIPPLLDPIAEYDHTEGISVIAGYVYQGSLMPSLNGQFVFADWGRSFGSPDGRLFFLNDSDDIREFRLEEPISVHITGFGQDLNQELYVVGSQDFRVSSTTGVLQKIVPTDDFCVPIQPTQGNFTLICL